jgi:hypothetical protein
LTPRRHPPRRHAVKGSDPTQWRRYPDAIAALGPARFDVVLIDGRFRVACALRALAFVDAASVVAIHDWGIPIAPNRERTYDAVLEFYEEVERADSLMVLRPKRELLSPGPARDAALARAAALLREKYYSDST